VATRVVALIVLGLIPTYSLPCGRTKAGLSRRKFDPCGDILGVSLDRLSP
jgi:hypothetical protein